MDAIGLDPRKPEEKKARAELHRLYQRIADLQYETKFDPDFRRDAEKHHELQQALIQAGAIIVKTKGEPAVRKFDSVMWDKMTSIQIAHEEIVRKHDRRLH